MMSLTESRQALHRLVHEYTRSFAEFVPSTDTSDAFLTSSVDMMVILLSGSTGAFGANILAALAGSQNVRRIYAFSRPSIVGGSIYERHKKAFEREGIDIAILEDEKIRLVEGDLSSRMFALESGTYEELQSSVTHIIHNAWNINFSLPVSAFEPNIRSVRNLVDFALSSKTSTARPAKFIFISSIGMFRNLPDPNKVWLEEYLEQPDCALGAGYTEAKWVSENILEEAARHTQLKTTVVRVGQLVGGPCGYWSEREWFAIMIKSSIFLGVLPIIPGALSWNRSHVAALALVDMLETEERYVHLIHPRPVSWMSIISIFSQQLNLPVVHLDSWMTVLQRSRTEVELKKDRSESAPTGNDTTRQALRQNPAIRLIAFFSQLQKDQQERPQAPDHKTVSCKKATAASWTLRNPDLSQIGTDDVGKWIENWVKVGFLDLRIRKKSLL